MERIANGRTAIICTLIAAGGLLGSTAMLCAGPLDPPAGAVAPTYKTLSEVEPRTVISSATTPGDATCTFHITTPGSYYFPGNLSGSSGKAGIKIDASDVTIDMCGFEFDGKSVGATGIVVSSARSGVSIRNGTVRAWLGAGIDLSQSSGALGGVIENIVAAGNGSYGLRGGPRQVVRSCTAISNSSYGIIVFDGGIAESCVSISNGTYGFGVGSGSTIRDCLARENGGTGIDATGSANILHCTSTSNSGMGILLGTGSLADSCVVTLNGTDGIYSVGDSIILNSLCQANGKLTATGAGIRVRGFRSRVEGNNCVGQDLGIAVELAGSVIVRNTCAGNITNWSIAANNIYGPIIDRTAPGSAAVNGNSAADALGSTHANANFSY